MESWLCSAALLTSSLQSVPARASLLDFTTLPASVQQDGAGDVSALANDVLAAWSNPAWLARLDSRVTGTIGGGGLYGFGEMAAAGGAAYCRSPWRLGLLASYFGMSYPEVSSFGEETGGALQQSGLGIEGAGSVRWGWFAPGLGVRTVSARIADMSESHLLIDLGVAILVDPVRVGIAVANVTAKGVPMQFRVGGAWAIDALKASVGAELVSASYGGGGQPGVSSIGIGADWQPARILIVRAGVGGIGNQMRISFGLTAFFRGFGVDAVFGTHPVGLTARGSVGYSYLPGSEKERLDDGEGEQAGSSPSSRQTSPAAAQPVQSAATPTPAAAPAVSVDAIFQQASSLYAAGDYTGAWGKAAEALKADPRHWQSWQMIGNCQYALGDKVGAMSSYRTCLQLNPDNPALKTWLDQQNP